MEVDKLERFRKSMEVAISATWKLFVALFNICIVAFLLFGGAAAIILLSKMFPETALTLTEPMKVVALFMYKMLKIVLITLFIFVAIWDVSYIIEMLKNSGDERKKRWQEDRKKFMDEVIVKVKRGLNKK